MVQKLLQFPTDNVTLHLDGVLYYRVTEPYLVSPAITYCNDIITLCNDITTSSITQASYGVENAEYAVVQLAQTTMRSELG